MTVLDMTDARSRRVGVATREVTISLDHSRASDVRGLLGRRLEFAEMNS